MTRDGSTQHCAYIDCRKRTDQPSFGQIHSLNDDQRSSYAAWLKQQHDGVVRKCQHTALHSPTQCCGCLDCPPLLHASHCAELSAACMDCM
jgi:hypothetical protein